MLVQQFVNDISSISNYFQSSKNQVNQDELRVKVQNAALRIFAVIGMAVAVAAYTSLMIPAIIPIAKATIPTLIGFLFYDLFEICQNGDRSAIAKANALRTDNTSPIVDVEQPGFKTNALYTLGAQILGTFSSDKEKQKISRENLKVLTSDTLIIGFATNLL